MLAERQIDEAISRLEEKIIALQLRPATQMMRRATIELRYAPDQPRVPAGRFITESRRNRRCLADGS